MCLGWEKKVECYAMGYIVVENVWQGRRKNRIAVNLSLYIQQTLNILGEFWKLLQESFPRKRGLATELADTNVGLGEILTLTCSKFAMARSRSHPLPSKHCPEKATLSPVRWQT